MPSPWKILASQALHHFSIFSLRSDRCLSPRTGMEHDFVVLEMPDWVNVVALTGEQAVVLVRQYRFGVGRATLEIPGGMVDEGEDPLKAAQRELLEETGYQAERWLPLGVIDPNPAIQNNRCYTFLAQGARLVCPPQQDEKEDIAVEERPLSAVPALLADGTISHALVAVAFQRLDLWQRGLI